MSYELYDELLLKLTSNQDYMQIKLQLHTLMDIYTIIHDDLTYLFTNFIQIILYRFNDSKNRQWKMPIKPYNY